jgi:hypothetical protein
MEKYESLIAQVNFSLVGVSGYNREQICEWTRKDIGDDVFLKKGEKFYFMSNEYEIMDITFTLRREQPDKRNSKIDIYTEHQTNFTNCDVNVMVKLLIK